MRRFEASNYNQQKTSECNTNVVSAQMCKRELGKKYPTQENPPNKTKKHFIKPHTRVFYWFFFKDFKVSAFYLFMT